MEKLQIRAIFARSFKVGFPKALLLSFLGLIAYSPFAYRLFYYSGDTTIPEPSTAFQLLTLLLSQLLVGTVSFVAIRSAQGKSITWYQVLDLGVYLMIPIVAVGLVSSIGALAIAIAPILLVPAVYATAVLYLAVPIAVVEQPSVIDCLRRSAERTKGHQWQVLGIILVQSVFLFGGLRLLRFLIGQEEASTQTFLISALALQALVGIGSAVIAGVVYLELTPANRVLPPLC